MKRRGLFVYISDQIKKGGEKLKKVKKLATRLDKSQGCQLFQIHGRAYEKHGFCLKALCKDDHGITVLVIVYLLFFIK